MEEDEPRYRPTSYSPPASSCLLASLSLDHHTNALPVLNSKSRPTDDKEDKSNGKEHSETALKYHLNTIPYALTKAEKRHKHAEMIALSIEERHLDTALEFHHTVPYTLPNAEERRRHAEIALKYYNKENFSNYHLVDAFLSNGVSLWDGTWFHCNFTAKPPVLDSPPRVFYAEICGSTWTVRKCYILEGEATVGCDSCPNAVHSSTGFLLGQHMISRKGFSHIHRVPCALPNAEERRRHAQAALDYFNKKIAVNYELVDALLSTPMLLWLDEPYFHCNFTAKLSNLDISSKLFFAEIRGAPFFRVHVCEILEGKTNVGCEECSNVIHPVQGFDCGYPKIVKLKLPSYSPQPSSYSPQPFLYSPQPQPSLHSPLPPTMTKITYEEIPVRRPAPVEYSNPHRRYAESAVFTFNRKNGTEYEVVDTLRCCDLLSDGSWFHLNFTGKTSTEEEEEISPKLFFCEIGGAYGCATACLMLEGEATTDGCIFCTEIKHPTHGFIMGLLKRNCHPQPQISVS